MTQSSVLSPQSVLLLACLSLCSACQPPMRAIYTGPTASLDEVVARIDANNSRIPSLWAHQDFDGQLVDDKHNAHSVTAHGVLLYRSPSNLLIRASGDFQTPLFEIGVTDDVFWLKVVPEMDTLWWGHMRNIGKPGMAPMPIQPDLILDVLAVGQISSNLNQQPYPVMRFNNDLDVYMVDTLVHSTDRMLVQKEVWYDRQTLEPRTVLLFDANARVVLRAHLSDFQSLAGDDSPRVAMQYDLLFPDNGSTMRFKLSDAAISKNGIPRAGGIHLPDLDNPGVKNVVQVDQNVR